MNNPRHKPRGKNRPTLALLRRPDGFQYEVVDKDPSTNRLMLRCDIGASFWVTINASAWAEKGYTLQAAGAAPVVREEVVAAPQAPSEVAQEVVQEVMQEAPAELIVTTKPTDDWPFPTYSDDEGSEEETATPEWVPQEGE